MRKTILRWLSNRYDDLSITYAGAALLIVGLFNITSFFGQLFAVAGVFLLYMQSDLNALVNDYLETNKDE